MVDTLGYLKFLVLALYKKWGFPLRVSSVNLTEEVFNGKLRFWCSVEKMKIKLMCKLTITLSPLKWHTFHGFIAKRSIVSKFVIFGRLSIILTTRWRLDYFNLSREHHVYRWMDLPNSMVATAHKSLPSKDGVIHISYPGLILGKCCMGTILKVFYRTELVELIKFQHSFYSLIFWKLL